MPQVRQTHMFAFYFGIVADVTPPVALAAYAGAGIAGANPMRCGVIAAKLAIAAFIVPYIFVLAPELLMINATAFTITYSALTAIINCHISRIYNTKIYAHNFTFHRYAFPSS